MNGSEAVDPTFELRSRQWAEYEKLCLELRLRHNSAVRWTLYPREETEEQKEEGSAQKHEVQFSEIIPVRPEALVPEKACLCGNIFIEDAIFCRKCGRERRYVPVEDPGAATGERRRDQDGSEEGENGEGKKGPRSVHEYSFARMYLGDRHFHPLAAALAVDRQMLALFLPGCGMKDNGMIKLCEQLKRSSTLECLDVSDNRFSIGGAEACHRLVATAQRLVLLKAKDTCLEEEFCNKRGLPAKYTAVRKRIGDILTERALSL
jgi:hypothetical protein